MELTFVNQYSGEPPKRRRLAKACESCRARKKRCMHYSPGIGVGTDDNEEDEPADGLSSGEQDGDDDRHDSTRSNKTGQLNETWHFVGDSDPQSTLLKRPAQQAKQTQRKRTNEEIGIWVDRSEWEALMRQKNNNDSASRKGLANGNSTFNANLASTETGTTSAAALTQIDNRPHSAVLGPLIDIYFTKIHPLLPLLDEREFRRQHVGGLVPEALVHAMCLAAAKDVSAEPHLRLTNDGSGALVSARRFCSVLHASVTAALRVTVRFDKVTLIRILALTWLHNEGPDGAEEASIRLSKAMHHAQTLGIHLAQQQHPIAAPASGAGVGTELSTSRAPEPSAGTNAHISADEMNMKRLFWSLYALDRMNAAINGRPILMSDADIASTPFQPGESGCPAFEAWLSIVALLNKIISFYRPTAGADSTGWEEPYPGLEEILDALPGAWDLPASVLATIHLFYLCVAILSHRTRGLRETPRAVYSQVRQRLCAIEVIRLLESPSSPSLSSTSLPSVPPQPSNADANGTAPPTTTPPEPSMANSLHPLPTTPYALSLALSVSYQHLRQSQLPHQQADALRDFRACCRLLQTLSKRRAWRSADVMAALAAKVLGELDRAGDLSEFRVRRVAREIGARAPAGGYGGSGGGSGGGIGVGNANRDGGGNGGVGGGRTVTDGEGRQELIPPPSVCQYDANGTGGGLEGAHGVGSDAANPTTAAAVSGSTADGNGHGMQHGADHAGGVNGQGDRAAHVTAPGDVGVDGSAPFDGGSLFENIDDVFGTFMDPNYPLSLEDMSFFEDFAWDVPGAAAEGGDGLGLAAMVNGGST